MIPILYEANEQDFTSNGLGRLSDTIACNVEEERNGSYELTMTYPITGIRFEDICLSRFVYAIPADGKNGQPFRIYHITKPINGIVEIHAEHISYQLSHIPISPFETTTIGGALTGLVDYSAETNPFTFWTDKTTVANFTVKEPTSCRALLGGMEGSILDTFGGGDYEFDKYTVKLHQNRGYDRGVTLRYGKNITDITQEENITNTYTGVYPFWKGTDENNDEIIVTLTEKVLHSANASNFPYQRTIPLDLSSEWENRPTQEQLRSRANSYMTSNNIGVPSVSIEVSFVALWQTEEYSSFANLERVNLCDTVTVYFSKLGISAQAKVVKTNYNVLKERYDSIELGDARSNFASQVKADVASSYSEAIKNLPTKSFLQKSVERATKLITGGLGGYVVITPNADGEPQEILVMDTDDIKTAVNVIRINKNGIGFSTNGYEGPFVSAWTIDGHFVADFIDTGNLNASLITTGTMNADLIHGGTLVLGGLNNVNGVALVRNASGTVIAKLSKDGVEVYSGVIKGPKVISKVTGRWSSSAVNVYTVLGDGKISFGYSQLSEDDPTMDIGRIYPYNTSIYHDSNQDFEFRHWNSSASEYQTALLLDNKTSDGTKSKTKATFYGPLALEGSPNIGISFTAPAYSPTASYTHTYSFEAYYPNDDRYVGLNFTGLLYIQGNRVSTSSSRRYKHEIRNMIDEEFDPKRLLRLKAKQFVYNRGEEQYRDTVDKTLPGFIAEDVAEIYPSAVIHKDGEVESWDERRIIPAMLSLIQEQHEEIQALKSELAEIKELLKGVVK